MEKTTARIPPIRFTLGEWLKIRRLKAGLTQTALGAELGVSRSVVGGWEYEGSWRQEKTPLDKMIKKGIIPKLCYCLGIEEAVLLDLHEYLKYEIY